MATLQDVKALVEKKIEVEKEIDALYTVLESHGSNMTDDLIDPEGYPRADVDVLTVRKTRVRVIYLQNDLKELLGKIEEGLYKIHADEKTKKSEQKPEIIQPQTVNSSCEPFLRVDLVSEGSPAKKAGLAVNDLIVQFGSLTCKNYAGLHMIGSLVQHSKEKAIDIGIKRDGKSSNITLIPSTWSGRGLLGCNIVPVTKSS